MYTLLSVYRICGVSRIRLLEYTAGAFVEIDSALANVDLDSRERGLRVVLDPSTGTGVSRMA